MVYALRELIYDLRAEKYVAEEVHHCPPEVDASTIRSYLRQRFGEPIDSVYTELPELGRVQVGWTYALPAAIPLPREDYDLVVIPVVEDPDDGSWVSMYVRQAEYHRLSDTLLAEGKVESVTHHALEESEWDPSSAADGAAHARGMSSPVG